MKKLLVYVSHSGICSRRKALDVIKSGAVQVNGKVECEPSRLVDSENDVVFYKGRKINSQQHVYIVLNKPKGVTTTKKDRFAKKTVMDILPQKYQGLWPVGRLDKDTTGLLLCTNDGQLSYVLTHPQFGVHKTYLACLNKQLERHHKQILEQGVDLEDGKTAACSIVDCKQKRVKITISEGRKRQVKRMFAFLGYRVVDLKRLSFAFLKLKDLPEGHWRHLLDSEFAQLQSFKIQHKNKMQDKTE